MNRLSRRLGLADAVVIGLGAMLGAGVFVSVAPAVAVAGTGLLPAVILAAMVALLNAMSMAQLAAVYPESGGAYAYARGQINPFWGFMAGWVFVAGKFASLTAMALTFGNYVWPDAPILAALAAVGAVVFVNASGVRKTAQSVWILVAITVAVLALVMLAGVTGGTADLARLTQPSKGVGSILQAAAMMFFAFAGYARIATLGEEVISPVYTIPRAILGALAIATLLYLGVAVAALLAVDAEVLKATDAPLAAVVGAGRWAVLVPLVRVGAAVACLSVLLSLAIGVSRTLFAMAAQGDLPAGLAAVHPQQKVPQRAEALVGVVVALLVLGGDVRGTIGFSAFLILLYYAIANFSAWKLAPEERMFPPALSLMGLVACVLIAISLPWGTVFGGLVVAGFGALIFTLKEKARAA